MRKKRDIKIFIDGVEYLHTTKACNIFMDMTGRKINKNHFAVYAKRGLLPPPDFKFKGLNFYNPENLKKWITTHFYKMQKYENTHKYESKKTSNNFLTGCIRPRCSIRKK